MVDDTCSPWIVDDCAPDFTASAVGDVDTHVPHDKSASLACQPNTEARHAVMTGVVKTMQDHDGTMHIACEKGSFEPMRIEDIIELTTQASSHILNNEICTSGRGLVIQDVAARIEGNLFAHNNGWAIHCDFRFDDAPMAQAAVLGNRVVSKAARSGVALENRTIRLSLPDSSAALTPIFCDNLLDDGQAMLPMIKRRRLEDNEP